MIVGAVDHGAWLAEQLLAICGCRTLQLGSGSNPCSAELLFGSRTYLSDPHSSLPLSLLAAKVLAITPYKFCLSPPLLKLHRVINRRPESH
jgi:hypothetical protein